MHISDTLTHPPPHTHTHTHPTHTHLQVGTTPFKDQLTDNVITKTAMENGVLPLVRLTNTLCCNASVQNAGTDDANVYNATNSCTVSGKLVEIHTTGQLAAYHEERQCVISPTLTSSSSTSEVLGGLEAGNIV